MKNLNNQRALIFCSFMVGLTLTMAAWIWTTIQTDQTEYYDRGVIAYSIGDYDLASQDFQRSYIDYNSRLNGHFGEAPPSLEQAELSQEHLALALLKMKQPKPAVVAFKECLYLTSDVYMSEHAIQPGMSNQAETAAAYSKIKNDGRDCKINLEILYHQQQSLANAEGQGQGNPNQGNPSSGDNPTSEDPSNGAGQEDRLQVNQ